MFILDIGKSLHKSGLSDLGHLLLELEEILVLDDPVDLLLTELVLLFQLISVLFLAHLLLNIEEAILAITAVFHLALLDPL